MYAQQATAAAPREESFDQWQQRLRTEEAGRRWDEQQDAKAARAYHYQQANDALRTFEGSGSTDWGSGLRALVHALLAQSAKSTR